MLELDRLKVERQTHPDLSPLSPFLLTVEYAEHARREFHADSHYALQICMVLHGEAEVILEDSVRTCFPGEIWWTMCWEPHAYRLLGRRNFVIAVNIDIEQLGDCGPFSGCNWLLPFIADPAIRFSPRDDRERGEYLAEGKALLHLARRHQTNWRMEAWLRIHRLILQSVNAMEHTHPELCEGGGIHEQFSRIKPVLNAVWTAEAPPPSLTAAAKLCSLSTSRFSELFRKSMGVSYGKFALRVRMSNAARDLISGRLTQDEIAERWGFFDASHFCHAFKSFYRTTPKQFVMRKSLI